MSTTPSGVPAPPVGSPSGVPPTNPPAPPGTSPVPGFIPPAIPAGQVQEYKFRLPTMNYVFKPGHRIMVQVQSSLFPLYDRNPQTFVPNIFFAKPADYQKSTISVMRGAGGASSVLLPVVATSTAVAAAK